MLNDLLHDANPWWKESPRPLLRSETHARSHLGEILASLESGERAMALVGPRQVGKTVLLKQAVEVLLNIRRDTGGGNPAGIPPQNVTYFSFDDDRIETDLSPRDVVSVEPHGLDPRLPRYFLLDEISRAHKWDAWLKQAVDRTRHGPGRAEHRFVVCDSASSLLTEGRVESGLGRWDELEVEPWTLREVLSLDPATDPEDILRRDPAVFDRYLLRGGFPGYSLSKASLETSLQRLRSDIVDVAIYKDLASQRIHTDLARRFFVYLARESGAEQNLSSRALDLGVDRRSLESWLALLQTTGLIRRLDRLAVTGKASSRLRPISRYFATDHGLVSALTVGEERDPTKNARLVETVVFRHLRELARSTRGQVGYYRDRSYECDFVLDAEDRRIAIEVTTADPRKHSKLRRIAEVTRRVDAEHAVVIHSGLEESREGWMWLLPLHRFLLAPEAVLERAGTQP